MGMVGPVRGGGVVDGWLGFVLFWLGWSVWLVATRKKKHMNKNKTERRIRSGFSCGELIRPYILFPFRESECFSKSRARHQFYIRPGKLTF